MTYTPYSTNTFITTVANEQNFNVTWTSPYYLEPTDVFAEVNGDPWTVSSVSGTTVTLQTGIPANARVLIYRETDISDNIVNFSAGSTFRAQDVNADFDQLLFKAQENTDFTNRLDGEIDLLTELVTNSLQFISVQDVEELNAVATTDPDNLKGYEVRDSTNIDTLANPVIANLPPAAGSNPGEDPVNGVYWNSGIVTRVLWNKPNQYWDFVLYFSGDADNRYQQLTLANPVTPDPADYKDGTLWFDSGDANLYILYNDGNSRQWVITNPLSAYGQIVTSDDVYWSRNASNNTVYPKNATDAITNLDASLSLNADGTASFSGLTTHEGGVKVTGGDSSFRQGCNFGNLQGGSGKVASLTWTRVNDSVKGSIGTGSVAGDNALFIQSDTNHPLMLGTNNTPWVTIREGGTAEFAGLTTHAGGVSVTGGNVTINPGQLKQGTTTSAAAAGTGVQLNGYVRAYGNETDFPETERSTPQPFQIISAPTASSTKSVKLSLNASGSAYFDGLTEHAGGVSVTGGRNNIETGLSLDSSDTLVLSTQSESDTPEGQLAIYPTTSNVNIRLNAENVSLDNPSVYNLQARFLQTGLTDQNIVNISSIIVNDAGTTGDIILFANQIVSSQSGGKIIGYKSAVNTSNTPDAAYNFYASGNAPNYFAGNCFFGVGALNNSDSIVSTNANIFGVSNSSGNNAIVELRGINNAASRTVQVFTSTTGAGAGQTPIIAGKIIIQANGTGVNYEETSDYRLKSNVVELSSTSDLIKSLKPCSYEMYGTTKRGFLAHELQEVCPDAVSGTKDATEAIGTLADYDGTVLETAVTEPEELTYTEEVEGPGGRSVAIARTRTWAPTGTRPVYQGVDQTKLIPLLTKALQEALTRIEALEAQVNSQNTEV